MHQAKLRAVGGSVMLAIPKPVLALANLKEGSSVGIEIENGNIVVRAAPKGRVGLAARLAMCDAKVKTSKDERDWVNMASVGREKID
jgi:antitoxin ChpS